MPTPDEITGRAYTLFMRDALDYLLELTISGDSVLVNQYIIDISNTWSSMPEKNRDLYCRVALGQLHQLSQRDKYMISQQKRNLIIDNIVNTIEKTAKSC